MAISHDKTWDETTPGSSTNAAASQITDFKTALRERLDEEHYFYASESGHDDVGLHKKEAARINYGTVASRPSSDLVDGMFYYATDEDVWYYYNGSSWDTLSNATIHASNHITGGDDEIDGDKLDIDWDASNYTPSTSPSEADSADNLTAHLKGIDDRLAGRWRTLWVPAGSMAPRDTNGAEANSEERATNDVQTDQFLFDGSTEEAVQFTVVFPDEWDSTADLKVKVYWDAASGASAADGVVWGVRAMSLDDDDAIDTSFGDEVTATDAVIAVGDLHVTDATSAITIAGSPTAQHLTFWQVARKVGEAGDDMTEDAKLQGVLLQYRESTTMPSAW